ncbi:Guanosine-diphosphatase [Gracilariopsis chorda]|uniref:Guanosine-diphosphatase n=1 Tax=Gracilariopsis chorda TaxID=448386 RepID=A0A2V3IZI8_9FLOR|nr:Guanosine-diphosphatase [Gracilariopsis chorda]|eukprot:PXF47097.1 Guanosine-diphosphatase [Gracilariopsis chorda]
MATKFAATYDPYGRQTMFNANSTRGRLVKLVAAVVVTIITISALRSVYTPSDNVYGLMIDAGSTGSRIHTFTFQKHPKTSKLEVLTEDFHAIKPGLSAYKDNVANAAMSLEPLIQRAKARVPMSAQAHTPVVLRATAGLRMVGEEVANSILGEVRNYLKSSGFRFDDDSWASILSGNEEGVYSWITVNYLLDRGPHNTVGTLEMGGGSSQVAYVPRDRTLNSGSANCSTTEEGLDFKGEKLSLYTTSHLGFGLQKARALSLNMFKDKDLLSDNPCVNSGAPQDIAIPFEEDQTITVSGKGDYAACRRLLDENLMDPSMGKCDCDVCTYHGSAQPPPIPEYVAIAFYLGRTVAIGMQTPLTVKDIRLKGEEVCSMTVEEVKAQYPEVPSGDATDLCLDLAYIALHLEHGHGITENSGASLMVMEKINDFELGWCLGAMQQTMEKLALK